MRKRLLILALALFAVLQTAWAYDFSATSPSGHTLYYEIISGTTNVGVVSPATDYNSYIAGDVVIPDTVTYNSVTYTVTELRTISGYYGTFLMCSDITSITIPNTVTTIGDLAFLMCSGLTSVTIPNSVTSIGLGAFSNCTGLTSVTIPNSVTSIGLGAFLNVKHIIYNGTATGSPWEALSSQNNFVEDGFVYSDSTKTSLLAYIGTSTNVTIPNSVTSIENYSFANCRGLNSVTIGDSVISIGTYSFASCRDLNSVIISNSVTSIGNSAFQNCANLNSVTIGNSVTSIGGYAFQNCVGLTSVTIPNSVTNIGSSSFGRCTNLDSVTIGDGVTSIESSAFYGCSALKSVSIPNSVTTIDTMTFAKCTSLSSVTFGDSVTSIAYLAFAECASLDSVSIPNSVTSIEAGAFMNCPDLPSIIIGDGVSSIGGWAFYGCSGLTSVTIGNSVTSIEDSAFIGCNNLYEVISLAILPPQLGEDIFPTTYMLKVPCGSANYYNSMASSWSQYFAEIEEMCNNITITVTSDNESMGTVSGGGEYEVGTEITITAIPNEGYHFVTWNDGNTDNPRTITVTEDATYIASFEEGVGIESRDMLSELAFYPNPTSGIITFNRSDIMKVEVLDAMGRMVAVYENAYTIDISKLVKGYYAMRITTAEGVAVRKVIRK